MKARPHKKKFRQSRFGRCPKCNKQLRKRLVRCAACHRVQ